MILLKTILLVIGACMIAISLLSFIEHTVNGWHYGRRGIIESFLAQSFVLIGISIIICTCILL